MTRTGRKTKPAPVPFSLAFLGLRSALRLSSEDLAELLGISQGYVSKIEDGKLPPNTHVLARALRISSERELDDAHNLLVEALWDAGVT